MAKKSMIAREVKRKKLVKKYAAKRKALLIINTGIFLAIFAFTSATISFFIEKKIPSYIRMSSIYKN